MSRLKTRVWTLESQYPPGSEFEHLTDAEVDAELDAEIDKLEAAGFHEEAKKHRSEIETSRKEEAERKAKHEEWLSRLIR